MERMSHGQQFIDKENSSNSENLIPEIDKQEEKELSNLSFVFENFLNNKFVEVQKKDFRHIDSFQSLWDLENWIAELVGETKNWQGRWVTPKLREGVKIFLEELIKIIKEKSDYSDEENKIQLEKFNSYVYRAWFSVSPSIANLAGLDGLIDLSVKATRVPEAQGYFGGNMVGEVVYELSFCSESYLNDLENQWVDRPISEVLDFVKYLQSVGAHAIANGEWARPCLDKIYKILNFLNNNYQTSFVSYVVDFAEDRLYNEFNNPSVSIFQYHGDRSNSRLSEQTSLEIERESAVLSSELNFTKELDMGDKVVQVASDAVSVLDFSNTARYYGKYKREKVLDEEEQKFRLYFSNLNGVLHSYRAEQLASPENIQIVLDFYKSDIATRFNEFGVGSEEVEVLSRKDPVIFIEKMKELFGKVFSSLGSQGTLVELHKYEQILEDKSLNPFGLSDEDLPLLLERLHEPVIREKVNQDLGIKLEELPLHSQIYLLRFLSEKNGLQFKRLQNVLHEKHFGNEMLVSFLSCAEDKKYGEAILKIAENVDIEVGKNVFYKYQEIVTLSEGIAGYIKNNFFGKKDLVSVDEFKIRKSLLSRANEMLLDYSKAKNKKEELISSLESIRTDLVVFASIFKNAFAKGQEIDFSQIKGLDLSIMDSGELSDQDKKQMRDIFKGNRTGVSPEFAEQRLKGEFDPVMSESGHKFYNLKKDGQIISFARFDELPNGNLYTGFINTAPDIKGMNIGSAFLETVFQREGQRKAIELKVREDNPAVKLYERFGFEIEGEPHEDPETKKVYLKMVRPPKAERLAEAA